MEFRIIHHKETHLLRHKVLWPHIPKLEDCVIDIDESPGAIHLGVFLDSRLISVGSLFEMHSAKIPHTVQYRLRAMATDPDFRGRHSGGMLLENAKLILRQKGIDALWCDARLSAVGFYERLGFHKLPEVYEVKNIGPHHFMWFDLNISQVENTTARGI
jgi:GNAT superfamily N-acetyltransferase